MRLPARSAGARVGARTPRPGLRADRLIAWLRQRASEQAGFTIVEVIVATVVLTVGLLTAYLMLAVAVHSSGDVRAREGAVSLARQVTEDARAIPYSQLSSSNLTTLLQAFPGLSNQSTGSSWQITRDGYTYTITAGLTPIYDSKDSANASSNTSVDAEQVSAAVSWSTFQGSTHTYTEYAIMTKAGQDPGLAASNIAIASPASGTSGLSGSSSAGYTISSTGITSLTFSVTAPSGTQAIDWSLNGAAESSWAGSAPSSGTTWTSSAWNISSVYDGTYTIGAQAVDSSGVEGPIVTMQVRLIRNVPSAPTVTGYGYDTNFLTSTGGSDSTVAEITWSSNPETNVVGYGIYTASGTLVCETGTNTSYTSSCDTNGGNWWCLSALDCMDLNANSTGSASVYKLRALYYDVNNNLAAGNATTVTIPAGTPTAPSTPGPITVTTNLDESATLTWPVSVGGATVSFYRVYRDGDAYSNRYTTVSASSCTTTCTYKDVNRAEAHDYYVTAVTSSMEESAPSGPYSG